MQEREIEDLVDSVIDEFRHFDLDPTGAKQEHAADPAYLRAHRHEYVRTVRDLVEFAARHPVRSVLEIGAFFGVVCICAAKLGFYTVAADIPEYMSLKEQQDRFGNHGIEVAEVRLEDYVMPFEDERFDAVIMCEVLEHLNFNPLPLIKEINRIGAPNSLFYLSLPNLAKLGNRMKLVRGVSNLTPIQDYFNQLDPTKIEIANGHWREYTAAEIREMLERLGYEIESQYYFSLGETQPPVNLRKRLSQRFYRTFPALKENQTTLAVRRRRSDVVFHLPDTVHRGLDRI
ncbi:MAG: class I SAM-dependent methyltransferase [Planctomycetes bacterium]|nr:class I SAM-dependent methyltransferase [Planctomycetota bacterium]